MKKVSKIQKRVILAMGNKCLTPIQVFKILDNRYIYQYIQTTMNSLAIIGILGKSRGFYKIKNTKLLRELIEEDEILSATFCSNKQCNASGKDVKMEIHHIDMFRTNNKPENLVRLCVKCHRGLHGVVRTCLRPPDRKMFPLISEGSDSVKRKIFFETAMHGVSGVEEYIFQYIKSSLLYMKRDKEYNKIKDL